MRSLSKILLAIALSAVAMAQESALREAQRRNPRNAETNRALADFLRQSGRANEAIVHYEAARTAAPADTSIAASLALTYIQSGNLVKAKPLIVTPNLEGHYLNALGDFKSAALAFQRAAEADPGEDNLFDLANHLLTHNGFDDSRKVLKWALERHPKSARLLVSLGVTEYSLGSYDEAVRALCAAVDLDPQDPRPLTFLGQMIGVSPALQKELTARLATLAQKYPRNAQAQYYYGLSLSSNGEAERAVEFFARAATLDAKDARPLLELGKIHADRNRLEDAVKSLQAALRRDPNLESAHYRLAQIYQWRKRPDLAAPHLAAYRKLRATAK